MIAAVHCAGTGPSHVKEASNAVLARVKQFEAASKLQYPKGCTEPVGLQWSDVKINTLLGSGSFSVVYKAQVTHPDLKDEHYAIKSLSAETICCNDSFVTGAIDLALEAKILSKLRHENIVQVHGVKAGNIADCFSQGTGGFFLVLDLLEETLDVRLDRWRKEEAEKAGILGGAVKNLFNRKRRAQKRLEAIVDRLDHVIMGIARGMEYIHQNNVILRDLKPHNIGFDKQGKVRIFDFGLARELERGDGTSNSACSTRCNTGIAGTIRYISPENALGKQCGLPSDVYSFAILLYEVITLQVPFDEIKLVSQFKEKVLRGHYRPSLKWVPSALLQDLLQDAWDVCPETRPSFAEIGCIMEEVISSGLLTKEGEWRNFVFKSTKPGRASRRLSGSSHHSNVSNYNRSFSDSFKRLRTGKENKKELDEEITILKQDLRESMQDASSKRQLHGSFHSLSNDQRRSFHENISFNSSKHQVHPL